MTELTPVERELVALAAAIASNCAPCAEVHIKEGRAQGLAEAKIAAAIHLAEKIRRVPAQKVLRTALGMLEGVLPESDVSPVPGGCCG